MNVKAAGNKDDFSFLSFPDNVVKVSCLKDRNLSRGTLTFRKQYLTLLPPHLTPPTRFILQFFSLRGLESLPRPPLREKKEKRLSY